MDIVILPALSDNYIHLIRDPASGAVAVVDPAEAGPVIEALTLDTPVILSDLPALREAAGGRGIYLRPDDVDGWAATIETLAQDDTALAGLREDIDGFRPMTAPAYFETVRDFLLSLGPRRVA